MRMHLSVFESVPRAIEKGDWRARLRVQDYCQLHPLDPVQFWEQLFDGVDFEEVP